MDDIKKCLKRYYTKSLTENPGLTVYDLFQWKKVDVFIKDHKTNTVLVDMKDLEFPKDYSQNACDIIASKYFKKALIPNEVGYENSLKMVVHRIVNFWCDALVDEGLINNENEKEILYDELAYCFLNQMYAPNSPQWFNTGLKHAYNIDSDSLDTFYYDEEKGKVVKSKDAYTRTQASACFILSIEDKLLGKHSISEQYVTETKLFKGGSGTGTNYSTIRAKGEKLSGGGISSGVMSFLKGLDRNAGAIKSGGTTRRAAKMVALDIDHPEIFEFIEWKAKEEDKVRALGKMGYDASFEGEAYETVSGQNGNNSIRLSNEFMKKVINLSENEDETIELKGRVDDSLNKTVKVSDLWDSFNLSAWKCADPAPQFDDTFNAWHTCPAGEDGLYGAKYNRINATNPCGEYAFLDNTSCNLASINVYKFYDVKNKVFDLEGYIHLVRLVQLALEASIHWGQFPTEDIARKTYLFRATGLGISNLASLLMVMGYPYDSDEARNFSASIIGILTASSYITSALMAKNLGAFKKYEINKNYMLKVIRNHARVAKAIDSDYEGLDYTPVEVNHEILINNGLDYISKALKELWNKALSLGESYGYRNAQVSVIAPTGTISFAMDCGATSIEPYFSHFVYKKLSGGGFMTIVNPVIEASLANLGYDENQIKDIVDYILRKELVEEDGLEYEKIVDGKIEGAPHLKEEHLPIFDTANKCGSGNRFIGAMGHVLMMASITPMISGAVSKTVNLPKNATVSDFKKVVINSWKLGVKGISLYRDGCKASQPLNTTLNSERKLALEDLSYAQLLEKAKELQKKSNVSTREKPEGIRVGTTHPAQIEDVKIYTTVNRNDQGQITEIYITTDREGTIITGLLNSLSKSISVMLQYHVPAQDIARMLRGQKYEPYGFVQKHPYIKHVTSISDLISKVIDIELGDFSRCQVKPDNNTDIIMINKDNYFASQSEISSSLVADDKSASDGERIYSEVCSHCSSTRLIKNGTCKVCQDCGTTTGCS
ncbi:MAG: vitamin B12-dependent ribonucleotide reductase [Clostridium argentinense]|uniref:Vitamin B12-dependent ribonucleotide reductase n=1 Tax=Clostridium faecium TaxID=2762223 RepID=A0ABR8YPS5_9CLOT|nr:MULTISPECIES: vitamin B12-dependent ribonucleotide reductase [Clostridium]MBD8045909.1 vitamin B12-dependent ribonucleotide reductase [Clostridium faecium]MBS5822548.1 vitamin B12-dependent ribonucleotide reductase [Clostridium argentinense]MDU1347987.1 vitamin B12-dependent ribonucleotide reductase [Clostridium argentinense]